MGWTSPSGMATPERRNLLIVRMSTLSYQTGLITGVEHVKSRNHLFNYAAVVLLVKDEKRYRDAFQGIHLKRHYAPARSKG